MEIKRPEPGEEPEQITLDVKDENSGTTISIDTVISPRKMTYEETMSCFDRAYDELLDILKKIMIHWIILLCQFSFLTAYVMGLSIYIYIRKITGL